MNESGRQRWLRTAVLLGLAYFVIGIAFGTFANWSTSDQIRFAWRLSAFIVCGIAFVVHIGYEHFRLGNSPRTTASHASVAVAVAAFALAAQANVHGLWVHSSQQGRLAFALVAWPVMTAVPAFVVALLAAAGLALIRRSPDN